MQQIKLDDKIDLAIDGNEAWIIDYSNLHAPKHFEKNVFESSPVKIELTKKSYNEVIISYILNGVSINKLAKVLKDGFITFVDLDAPLGRHLDGAPVTQDEMEEIEKEYLVRLIDIDREFDQKYVECRKSKNRDAVRLLEIKKDRKRAIDNAALTRHRAIQELVNSSRWKASPK